MCVYCVFIFFSYFNLKIEHAIALKTDDATGYGSYIIPSLKLDKGWFLFSSVSKFLSSITPNDVPLGEFEFES